MSFNLAECYFCYFISPIHRWGFFFFFLMKEVVWKRKRRETRCLENHHSDAWVSCVHPKKILENIEKNLIFFSKGSDSRKSCRKWKLKCGRIIFLWYLPMLLFFFWPFLKIVSFIWADNLPCVLLELVLGQAFLVFP